MSWPPLQCPSLTLCHHCPDRSVDRIPLNYSMHSLPCLATRCQSSSYLVAETPLSLNIFPPLLAHFSLLTPRAEPLALFTYCMFPLPRKPAEPLLCKHSQTHTHTKQEDYTCFVWVGWELSGKTDLNFVPLKSGQTGRVNTGSLVSSPNEDRWF